MAQLIETQQPNVSEILRLAHLVCDKTWEARAAGIWAEIEKSVRLYVGYMQGEVAYVRTGYHRQRIGDVETGRFEAAREIPVAIFPQHTSRKATRRCTSTCCG